MAEAPRLRGWAAPWIYPTGLFIRDYLLKKREAYPQQIWRELKKARATMGVSTTSYSCFCKNYIYVLKKLGLIEPVRREPNPRNPKWWHRTYYRIVPGRERDPRWAHPQIALDPRRGASHIRREYARERKLRVPPAAPLTAEEIEGIWSAASKFLRERGFIITREEFTRLKPEWLIEVAMYKTFEGRVGYVIREAAGIAYVSRIARRPIRVEEAPEPFRSEAVRLGKTLEREWLKR